MGNKTVTIPLFLISKIYHMHLMLLICSSCIFQWHSKTFPLTCAWYELSSPNKLMNMLHCPPVNNLNMMSNKAYEFTANSKFWSFIFCIWIPLSILVLLGENCMFVFPWVLILLIMYDEIYIVRIALLLIMYCS